MNPTESQNNPPLKPGEGPASQIADQLLRQQQLYAEARNETDRQIAALKLAGRPPSPEEEKNMYQSVLAGLLPPPSPDATQPQPVAPGNGEAESTQVVNLETAFKTREPQNIMEIVEGIMDNADKADFKPGGKYALVRYEDCETQFGKVDPVTGKNFTRPVFVPENYARWFRDRIYTIRDDFSPNKHVDLWTGININMGFRTMNFIKMYDLATAWRLEDLKKTGAGAYRIATDEVVDKDPDGKPRKDSQGNVIKKLIPKRDKKTGRVIYEYDKENATILNGLKDDITKAVQMSNYMYRNDTMIRPSAPSETDFPKGFFSAFENNEMTKNSMYAGYGHMYHMNEASKEEIEQIKEKGTKERGKLGQAAQIATLLYYNLKHIDKFSNHIMYFDYDKIEESKNGEKYLVKDGDKIKINTDGTLDLNADDSVKGSKKIKRTGENIFENILNADVTLQMGRNVTIGKDATKLQKLHGKDFYGYVDGVKEFYGSMARRALTEEFGKRVEDIEKDPPLSDQEKTKYKDILEVIKKANDGGVDWLSEIIPQGASQEIQDAIKAKFERRIRDKKSGLEEFDTEKMDNASWDTLWNNILTLHTDVLKLLPERETNLEKKAKLEEALALYDVGQDAQKRKKFSFKLLQSLGIIEKAGALNVFDRPQKSMTITNYVRGAVQDTIRAKTGIDDMNDAKFADLLNHMLWDTFMMYGLNDTGYVGFRGYSKVMNLRGYRRKSVDYRSEKNGNLFDIDDIKGLLLDPLRAWKVTNEGQEKYDRSFLEEVQGGQGFKVDLNNMKRFSFEVGTEKQYAGDPVSNSAKLYQSLVDPQAIDFLKDLSWGTGGEIQRGAGFRKMMELLHDIRYSLDRGYPYESEVEEWYQDDEKNWHVKKDKTRNVMFTKAVSGLDMYNVNSKTTDGQERFEPRDGAEKMGRNLFFFIMQRWILARRVPFSSLPEISRAEIELIRTAYKTFPTAWKNIKGKQIPTDFMLMPEEWKRIENGGYDIDDNGTKSKGFHTSQTRGADFVDNRVVQGVGGFVAQSYIAARDLVKLFMKTDWH